MGYAEIARGCWQHVDLIDFERTGGSQVGPQWATKAELLANSEAYCRDFGLSVENGDAFTGRPSESIQMWNIRKQAERNRREGTVWC